MSVVKAGELAQKRDAYRGSVRVATRQGTTFKADALTDDPRGSPAR